MADSLRFAAEEHFDGRVVRALAATGVDILTFREAGLAGRPDAEQLEWAFSQSRVVLTHDRDYLVLDARGANHADIFYCHAQKYRVGELIRQVRARAGEAQLAGHGVVTFL